MTAAAGASQAALGEALDRADAARDPAGLAAALREVSDARVQFPTRDAFNRTLAAALRGLAMAEAGEGEAERRLGWTAETLAAGCLHDRGARNRTFIEESAMRWRALMRPEREGTWVHWIPSMHVPLNLAEAARASAPWFAAMSRWAARDPSRHLRHCWDALTMPQPPFDAITWDWLDARGEGEAMRRALALHWLSEEGRQHIGARDLEAEVLAQLSDPHPLVAAHAGRFLGGLMAEPERINGGAPPWAEIMDRIATLPRTVRLPAAGGFLNGADAGMEGFYAPFDEAGVAREAAEDWVFTVLDGAGDDPALPGVQSFWFPLHEAWSQRPDLARRLIEAGKPWIALMCATEDWPPSDLMRPVLERLASGEDVEVAEAARRSLERAAAS